jgi:hypothetical protein
MFLLYAKLDGCWQAAFTDFSQLSAVDAVEHAARYHVDAGVLVIADWAAAETECNT